MSNKVTVDQIDEMVENAADIQYHHFEGTTTVVCLVTLQNGFSLVGDAACINMSDFDLELGKDIAVHKAKEQLWALEAYLRKNQE